MAEIVQCARCGKGLTEISYIEPDWTGHKTTMGIVRKPLCKWCWEGENAEAMEEAKRRRHG